VVFCKCESSGPTRMEVPYKLVPLNTLAFPKGLHLASLVFEVRVSNFERPEHRGGRFRRSFVGPHFDFVGTHVSVFHTTLATLCHCLPFCHVSPHRGTLP
jgi:hypothetical protein